MPSTARSTAVTALALLALSGCTGANTTATAPTSTARTAPTATSTVAGPTTTTTSGGAATTAPAATTTGAACGVDLAARAITAAVPQLRPALADPARTQAWNPKAQGGNYDPCATLSAALVHIDGATGSSPEQVMMFHDGVYQGTGTVHAYGFTTIDAAASTDNTVVVDYGYLKPGETTAGASGRATVRYQWVDGAVRMLDTLPSQVTG